MEEKRQINEDKESQPQKKPLLQVTKVAITKIGANAGIIGGVTNLSCC